MLRPWACLWTMPGSTAPSRVTWPASGSGASSRACPVGGRARRCGPGCWRPPNWPGCVRPRASPCSGVVPSSCCCPDSPGSWLPLQLAGVSWRWPRDSAGPFSSTRSRGWRRCPRSLWAWPLCGASNAKIYAEPRSSPDSLVRCGLMPGSFWCCCSWWDPDASSPRRRGGPSGPAPCFNGHPVP